MPTITERLRAFASPTPIARPRARDVIHGEVGKDDPDDIAGAIGAMATDREVNPDLVGNERYARLDEMVMSDPVVHGSLLSMKLPIAGTAWSVVDASDDPVDRMVARAARKQLGLAGDEDGRQDHDSWMAGGWDALLWLAMLHLDYGSMTIEKVWADDLVSWDPGDGVERPILPLVRMAPRYPHSLDRYKAGPNPGQPLTEVYQTGRRPPLPGGKLVHLVHQAHLSRYTGSSVLRPAYGIWKLKRKMIVSAAIGYDRFAAGVPLVRSPGTGGPEEERLARSIGRDYKNHERAYYWLKGRKPGPGEAGWDLEILNGAGALADPIPQLRHYDEQMVSAVLGRFFMLGSTDTGSRAVGEVLAEPYYMSLNWHAARMARELTQQVLAPWVEVNFGVGIAVPRIVPATIQPKNLPTRGDFIESAQRAGVTFSDVAAQNIVRGWVDIPPLPEGYVPADPNEGTSPVSVQRTPRAIGPQGTPATPPAEPSGPPTVPTGGNA